MKVVGIRHKSSQWTIAADQSTRLWDIFPFFFLGSENENDFSESHKVFGDKLSAKAWLEGKIDEWNEDFAKIKAKWEKTLADRPWSANTKSERSDKTFAQQIAELPDAIRVDDFETVNFILSNNHRETSESF